MKLKLHLVLTPDRIKKLGNLFCASLLGGLAYLAIKYSDPYESNLNVETPDVSEPIDPIISKLKKNRNESGIPDVATKADAIRAIVNSSMTSYDKNQACSAVSGMREYDHGNFAAIIAAAKSTSMTSYDRRCIIEDFSENA